MNIQFIRECPCKIDGKTVRFKIGAYHEIDEKHAHWMLECGYAIPQIKMNKKALKEVFENKSLDPTKEDKEVVQPKKRGRPKKDKENKS